MALMQHQIHEQVDFSEERLSQVTQLLSKHKKILEDKNGEFVRLSTQISVLESQKETPLKLKDKIISLENCPTCLQKVGDEHKDRLSKQTMFEIDDINRELEQKILEKQNVVREVESEKKLVREYESDKTLLQQNKIKYEHQLIIKTKLKSDAFVLDRTSNEIKQLLLDKEELKLKIESFSQSQEVFDKAKSEFQNVNEVVRTKEISSATKNRELELLKTRLQELSDEISKKEKTREELNGLRSLLDWILEKFISMINLTEKNVMVKLRNEFSKIFSEWFSMLVSDSLTVRLDEDFTPIITNQGYEIDYNFLSGGERTATALAYRLSLNQVLNSMLSQIKTKDILILDEPTDGFSAEQIDKMRDIFDQLKAEQMILVSHEEKIEGFVDHVVKVKKDGDTKVETI